MVSRVSAISLSTTNLPALPSTTLPALPQSFSQASPGHVTQQTRLTISNLQVAGTALLVFCLISILINTFFSALIFRNWDSFKRSKNFNTGLLCVLLTLADLVFVLFLGFPTSLHLTWMDRFKEYQSFLFYSRKLIPILLKFVLLLRVLVITMLSLNRCLQLVIPAQYRTFVTRLRVKHVTGLIVAVPVLLELTPSLVVFFLNQQSVICGLFSDPQSTALDELNFPENFSIPLTCETHLRLTEPGSAIPLFELTMLILTTTVAWFVILASNLTIITIILKLSRKSINKENASRKRRMTTNMIRSSIMVVIIAILFSMTTLPYAWIQLTEFLYTHTDSQHPRLSYKVRFYLCLLTFVPVIFHPWLYLLRMRNVVDMMPSFSRSS